MSETKDGGAARGPHMTRDELKALLAEATPGPWLWRWKTESLHAATGDETYRYGDTVLAPSYEYDTGSSANVSEANARLIAAAPDLLAEVIRLREALSLTRRANDLREIYHRLPNDKNRIGDKRSRKSHARDAWLRAFRKAAAAANAALTETPT